MFGRLFGIDYRTLALFRVAIGLTVLANIINLSGHITALFSDRGVMTRAAAYDWLAAERWSIFMTSGQPAVLAGMFALSGLVAVLFIIGYRTRLMTLLLWVVMVSLANRNPIIQQGGDILMSVLLFWSIFLPLGARFSVDAALARGIESKAQALFTEPRLVSPAALAILIQASYVYWVGALLKTGPEWIPDGTAVYYAMHLDSFAMPVTYWFRQFGDVLQGFTYFVWGLELVMPVLVFSPIFHVPLRLTGQFLLISMHLGFIIFLGIGLFPAASISSLLLYTPSEFWDWLGRKLRTKKRQGVALFYDKDCGFCLKICLILREFCLLPDTPIRQVQDDKRTRALFDKDFTWVVEDHDGSLVTGWKAVNLTLLRSPLFAPLGWFMSLKPFLAIGEWVYGWISRNRGLMGRMSNILLPYRTIGIHPSRPAQAIVVLLTVLVLYLNMLTLPKISYKAPAPVNSIARFLKLDQTWNMFAAFPAKVDGWIVVPGVLEDGTQVELFTGRRGAISYAKPENIYFHYGDYRWRKYFNRLPGDRYREPLRNYARYLCRTWNRFEQHETRLKSFDVIYMREFTQPAYGGNKSSRVTLIHWNCFE